MLNAPGCKRERRGVRVGVCVCGGGVSGDGYNKSSTYHEMKEELEGLRLEMRAKRTEGWKAI